MQKEGLSTNRSENNLRIYDRTPERKNHMMFNMSSKIDTLPGPATNTNDIVNIRVTKPGGMGGVNHSYMLRNGSCFELKSPHVEDSPKPKLFTKD